MNTKHLLLLSVAAALLALLTPVRGVVADTFISGHRMFFDRVDDRGVTDNQILKYDATTNKWLPDSDDVGEDTSLPSNDTASATLRGNDAGDGWVQNTSLKSTSGGVVTLTGASAQIVLEKGGSEAATIAGDDLIIRDVDGSGADVGISILTDAGTDAFAGVYFGSGTVEHNSWIRSKDTYMDLRVDETTWVSSLSTQTNLKLPVLFENTAKLNDDKTLTFGTENDVTIQYDENGNDNLQITGPVAISGVSSFGNTLTVAGLLTATTGGKIPDDQTLTFGTGNDVTIQYDENGNDNLQITGPVAISGASSFGSTLGITGVTTLTGGAKVPDDTTIAFGDLVTPDATIQYDEDGDNDLQITGNTSVVGTFSTSGSFTVNADKFTVDGDTGETLIADELVVSGLTSTSGGLSTTTIASSENVTLGNDSTDVITCNGRFKPRVLTSSPDTLTQGTVGEIAYCSADSKVYVCTGSSPYIWSALN